MNTNWLRHSLACAFFPGLLACGPIVTNTGFAYPPRAPGCEFEVFTAPPQGDYDQIAIIDVPFHYAKFTEFKSFIRASVCETGGDAIYATTNRAGAYAQAIVLKRAYPESTRCSVLDANAPPGAECPSALPPPPFPPPTPLGCQFDTQCKGDRVCTYCKCTAPTAAPAPATSAH